MKIRILKDGEDGGHSYKKGEIYEAKFIPGYDSCVSIPPRGSLVTYRYTERHGLECEILSGNKLYELW